MANLITHSLSFSKESISEYFLKPLFLSEDIRKVVTVRMDVKNSEKLDFIDKLEKITKSYAQGDSFSGSTGVTITQKTLSVSDMKAQVQQNGKAFKNYVKEALLKKGVDENDISDTLFEQIVLEIFMNGIARDLQRQIFFNDPLKETVSSDIATGTADDDYNDYTGFWTRIQNDIDASTIAASQYINLNSTTYLNTAGVAQVATCTLTGTSGTANITINGTAYLATFTSTLTATAAAFVTSHAATIAARWHGAVVTSSGADVIVTSNTAGTPISVSNAVNASGNLAGTTAATQANVAMGSVKAGGALAAFKAMWAGMPEVLRSYRNSGELRFMVTSSLYDNYTETIEALNGSEAAYTTLLDGRRVLSFRGVTTIERPEWGVHIDEDFGSEQPHRALLTIPRNLVVGTDGMSDDTNIEMWYEKKTQENYFRAEYKAGTQYIHDELIVAAY